MGGLQAESLKDQSLGRRPRSPGRLDRASGGYRERGLSPVGAKQPRPVVAPSRRDVPFQGLVMKKDYALLAPADPGRWPGL